MLCKYLVFGNSALYLSFQTGSLDNVNGCIVMDIARNIHHLCRVKSVTLRRLAEKIDMSEAGLSKALSNNDFKLSTLYRISTVLKVPLPDLLMANEKFVQRYREIKPGDIDEISAKIKELEEAINNLKLSD
jgi:transcriptional regulator with XRE-family HTH domain